LTASTAAWTSGFWEAGACAGALPNAARAARNAGLAASLAWIWPAAWLSATAPMMAGPSVNPKSLSWLVVPEAMLPSLPADAALAGIAAHVAAHRSDLWDAA
jgi:hypothetical protein